MNFFTYSLGHRSDVFDSAHPQNSEALSSWLQDH